MDLTTAGTMARSLMTQHGLGHWRFTFDRARRRFGMCSVDRRLITLSAYLTGLNGEAEVRDTILHEIAHALTPGNGHGQAWKDACTRIGAKPERTFRESDGVQLPRTALRVGCTRCNWWAGRHRVTWRLQVCRKCREPVIWEHVHSGKRYHIQQVPGGYRAIPYQTVDGRAA